MSRRLCSLSVSTEVLMSPALRKFAERAVRNTVLIHRMIWAKKDIERELPCWKRGSWTCMLEAAVFFLIKTYGEKRWIKKHPWVLRLPNPPLHAAGFCTHDMRRYNSLMSLNIGGHEIQLYPEDGARLFHEARDVVQARMNRR